MGVHDAPFTFDDVVFTLLFVACVWIASKVASKYLSMPGLVGEIVIGALLGPRFLDLVPKPDALMLYGELGLVMLIVEAGLDVDVDTLKIIGARGVAVAVFGSFIPMAIGFGFAQALGLETKSSLVVGASVAPTSMGIALNVLKANRALNTPTGQLIIAAAILDDIIALIILSELEALDDPTPANFIIPIVSSLSLLLGMGWFAIARVPAILDVVMPAVPERHRDNAVLGFVVMLALALVEFAHVVRSSHLLGAFLAGLCFCRDDRVLTTFHKQAKRVMHWLLKLFFACTIGFEIPVKSLWTGKVMSQAALFSVAIVGKLATGIFAVPLQWSEATTVAFAMSAWGEFAFIVATSAIVNGTIDEDTFSSIVLAVVISVIVSPFLLRHALVYYQEAKREAVEQAKRDTADAHHLHPVYYCLQTRCIESWGHQDRLVRAVFAGKCSIIDFRSFHVQDLVINEIYLKDLTLELPADNADITAEQHEELDGRIISLYERFYEAVSSHDDDTRSRSAAAVLIGRWLPAVHALDQHTVFENAQAELQKRADGAGVAETTDDIDLDYAMTHVERLVKTKRSAHHELDGFVHRDEHDAFSETTYEAGDIGNVIMSPSAALSHRTGTGLHVRVTPMLSDDEQIVIASGSAAEHSAADNTLAEPRHTGPARSQRRRGSHQAMAHPRPRLYSREQGIVELEAIESIRSRRSRVQTPPRDGAILEMEDMVLSGEEEDDERSPTSSAVSPPAAASPSSSSSSSADTKTN